MARSKRTPRRHHESHYLAELQKLREERWINTRKIKRAKYLYRQEVRNEARECTDMAVEDKLSKRLRSVKYFKECFICRRDLPVRQFAKACSQCTFDVCVGCRKNVMNCPQCRLEYDDNQYYVEYEPQ